MTDEPRTHYQITFTARQAVVGFLGLLLSLALAYYLGLMSGLSGRPGGDAAADQVAENAAGEKVENAPKSAGSVDSEPLPPIETAVPTAAASASSTGRSPGSRTELAGGAAATPPPAEPTPPTTLQTFQDGTADESSPVASASGSSGPVARPASETPGTPGKYWVQVASLSSRDEAGSLSSRLTRHGFRSQVLTATGPRGKGKVYRVRVGPYRSEDDAARAATRLSRQENVKSPWVVPDGM